MPIAVVRVVVDIAIIVHIEHIIAIRRVRRLLINYPLLYKYFVLLIPFLIFFLPTFVIFIIVFLFLILNKYPKNVIPPLLLEINVFFSFIFSLQ